MPGYHTDKQKRQAKHVEASERKRGVGKKEATSIAWATVNKQKAKKAFEVVSISDYHKSVAPKPPTAAPPKPKKPRLNPDHIVTQRAPKISNEEASRNLKQGIFRSLSLDVRDLDKAYTKSPAGALSKQANAASRIADAATKKIHSRARGMGGSLSHSEAANLHQKASTLHTQALAAHVKAGTQYGHTAGMHGYDAQRHAGAATYHTKAGARQLDPGLSLGPRFKRSLSKGLKWKTHQVGTAQAHSAKASHGSYFVHQPSQRSGAWHMTYRSSAGQKQKLGRSLGLGALKKQAEAHSKKTARK